MTHEHLIIDDDQFLLIDPLSRAITNQNYLPEKILQGDHNCERLTFHVPRDIDGHDITLCNLVRVHFVNIGEDNQKIYGLEDIAPAQYDEYNPDVAVCSWLISGKATRLVGKLHFCIQFCCVEDGLITYSWSTAICTNLSVSSSMDNIEVDDEYNKTINDVPFTVDDKNKLDGLPTGEELEELINTGGGGSDGVTQAQFEEFKQQVYDDDEALEQYIRGVDDRVGNVEESVGDIHSALDELHNYAKGLIGGET